ncbi:natriuretic peptides B [Ornithorhynchus anatinus]|uniref:Natriuretic peptides B n=1 Tax=Ornithorhynchus anatinus TaxID=9258 RepID=A0A6I8PD75_ORNAN|nr:natriuretic peptides B [Ornithorhynchus anatinus]
MDCHRLAVPRALLLLLLVLLQARGGRALPLAGLSPARELAGVQELLNRLREKFSVLEELEADSEPETEAEEPAGNPAELWEESEPRARARPATAGSLEYRSPALQALRGLQNPKFMRESGCFGRRLDRIGSISGLGCNGFRKN